jgi:hypothetical protein
LLTLLRSDADEFIETADGQIKPRGINSAKQHKYLKQVRMVTLKGFSFVNTNIDIDAQNFK